MPPIKIFYKNPFDKPSAQLSLYLLAKNNAHKTLAELLKNIGYAINLKRYNNEGKTALHIAAESGATEVVSLLTQPKYLTRLNLNAVDLETGSIALQLAKEHKHADIVHILQNLQQNTANTEFLPKGKALHFDAQSLKSLVFLLAKNDEPKSLIELIEEKQVKKLNYKYEGNQSLLHIAVVCDSTQMIDTLLSTTIQAKIPEKSRLRINSVNEVGATPLMQAAFSEGLQAAEQLLRAGAKIHTPQHFDGYAPIHVASEKKILVY